MALQAESDVRLIRGSSATGTVLYTPEIFHRAGNYNPELTLAERELEQVIRDIAHGQYENMVSVIAVNVSEGKCWDASVEIAQAVLNRLDHSERIPNHCIDFLEQYLGCRVVAQAQLEAA